MSIHVPGIHARLAGSRRRQAAILALLAVLGTSALLVTGVVGSAVATDPYVAGQPATRVEPLPAQTAARAFELAERTARALGLPAAQRRTVERVDDRRAHTTYDEVTDLDSHDRPIAILRFATDGRLLAAARLGWIVGDGPRLADDAAAVRSALAFARATGIKPGGPGVARARGANGWTVEWTRVVDSVPVPGDGVRIALWPNGSFHSLSTADHPLAGRPSSIVSEADARARAGRLLDGWIPARQRRDIDIVGASLAWIAPNDTFDSARPDAPANIRRLAWVVPARSSGALAEILRGLEIDIDAGDGSLLGGDVLQ